MNIGIIGAGNLGKSFIDGLKEKYTLLVSDIYTGEHNGIPIIQDNKKIVTESDIVILIVKPQVMEQVVTPLVDLLKEKLVISFAAGVTIKKYMDLGLHKIIRAMPNIAVGMQQGIIGYSLSQACEKEDEKNADNIFSSVGKSVALEEPQLNILTGLSGSGIAYFISMAENFITAGKEAGISKEKSVEIVAQTLRGAASLLEKDTSFVWLKRIASAGGTTEQGLLTMKEKGIDTILKETIQTTIKKCQDLSKK